MAITVQVKPDLSAFREATVDEIATQLCDELGRTTTVGIKYADCKAVAKKLLERYWTVPK